MGWILMLAMVLMPMGVWAHPSIEGPGSHVCESDCAVWGLADGEMHSHMSDGGYTNSSGNYYDAKGVLIDSITPEYTTTPESAPDAIVGGTNGDGMVQDEEFEKVLSDASTDTDTSAIWSLEYIIGLIAMVGLLYGIYRGVKAMAARARDE